MKKTNDPEYDIVFYRKDIIEVGGIETWLYNLARTYGKSHKIAVVYSNASFSMLSLIAQHVEVIKYRRQEIRSKKAVFCYDLLGYETAIADERIYTIHAVHSQIKNIKLVIPDDVDRVVAVSDVARLGAETDRDIEVVYNPVIVSEPKKILRLVSGTRLTSEKGYKRIVALSKALEAAGVLYEWSIFTNSVSANRFSPNVIFRSPTRDLMSYVASSDYLVQLSDTESYCFAVVESLSIGTPVIVTEIPVLKELGVTKKHGVIIPLDERDFSKYVNEIVNGDFNFKYKPLKDKWSEIMGEGSGSDYELKSTVIRNVHDKQVTLMLEGLNVEAGETAEVFGAQRLAELLKTGFFEVVEG